MVLPQTTITKGAIGNKLPPRKLLYGYLFTFVNRKMDSFTLYERIKLLAKATGKTLKVVESDLGLSEGNIKKWKKHLPSCNSLIAVADYFGVSIDYLLNRTGDFAMPLDESLLIEYFHKMNKQGQDQLLEYAQFLSTRFLKTDAHKEIG